MIGVPEGEIFTAVPGVVDSDSSDTYSLKSTGATRTSHEVSDRGHRSKNKIPKGREGLLLNALAADPRNVDALTRLGLLYEQRSQWSKCNELLHRATMVDPKRTQYLYVHIAHAHLCQQQWQEALDVVHRAVTHPENRITPMLHYTTGRLYDRVDQTDVAELALRECLKLSPWYPESREVFFRLGCMYREMSKYERAFYCLSKAVTDGNGSGFFDISVIWLELGTVARLLHKNKEANAAFANAGLDPDLGTSWHYAGNEYLGKLEYIKAFRCFRKAVALDPENHDLWASLIDLYRTMGQNEEALEAYYGFATIDAAAKLRREHTAAYDGQLSRLEERVARQAQALNEKEQEKKAVQQLANQQQKILQGLNDDLDTQRKSRTAREAFLEMQLKEATRKENDLKSREDEITKERAEWEQSERSFAREKTEWAAKEQRYLQLSLTGGRSLLPGEASSPTGLMGLISSSSEEEEEEQGQGEIDIKRTNVAGRRPEARSLGGKAKIGANASKLRGAARLAGRAGVARGRSVTVLGV